MNESLQNIIDRLNAAENKARIYSPVAYNAAGRIKKQTFAHGRLAIIDGAPWRVVVKARFDDECGNGHETFAITGDARELKLSGGEIYEKREGGEMGGCIHEIIAAAFPELAHVIKWHLTSTDGPMHYIANTCYHARTSDHNGLEAGEVSSWSHGLRFGNSPITWPASKKLIDWIQASYHDEAPSFKWLIEERAHVNKPGDSYDFAPHYTLSRCGEAFADNWTNCEFRTRAEAEEVAEALNLLPWRAVRIPTAYSKGKPRELDAARRSAVWLDASDEDLTAPGLAERLAARLPSLLADFKADMLALGFTWPEAKTEEPAAVNAR